MSNENKFPLKKENTDVAKENREKRNTVRIGNTPFTLNPLQRASWNTVSVRDTLHAVLWICTVYHQ
jgi:hypothetical protein